MSDISKLSDEEVIVIVRTKDREVYAEIIKRYQSKLMRYASYIMGDEQMGADVVQEGFIKAYILTSATRMVSCVVFPFTTV